MTVTHVVPLAQLHEKQRIIEPVYKIHSGHKRFAVIMGAVLLLLLSGYGMSFAKEFPAELRVVAKSIANPLYISVDDALKVLSEKESRMKLHNIRMDVESIKAKDKQIQRLADESLQAVSEIIASLDSIDSLPKPDHWNIFWGSFIDGVLIGSGNMPIGTSIQTIQNESAKGAAIASEVNRLTKAYSKLELQERLLPRVARTYSATPTRTSNGERISVCFTTLISAGFYVFINNGESLEDCILEITVSGATGDKVTFCCFVEEWVKGQIYFLCGGFGIKLENGEAIGQMCANVTNKVELTLLSPEYSTSVEYEYGQKERDDDYATMFEDVELTATYSEVTGGIFENWARYATIYMRGASRLPPCTLSVTFDGEGKTYSEWNRNDWKAGEGWKIYGNNKSGDACKSFSAVVTFPRTNFKIKKSWTVGR